MFYTNNIFGLNCGRFVIYTGNMFGGKSEALVGNVRTVSREEKIRVKSAKREGQIIDPLSIGVFKPIIDNRYSTESVVTHDGKELPCIPVYTVDELVDYIEEHDVRVIAIDEIQFLNDKDENGHYKIVQAVHRFLQEKRYVQTLSDRELQILKLIGEGASLQEIAYNIGLSLKTIETYSARIKIKLRLTSGHDLLRFATLWCFEAKLPSLAH